MMQQHFPSPSALQHTIRTTTLAINRVIEHWLFRPGGQYNCALARIAIAVALWLTLNYRGNFFHVVAWDYEHWIALSQGSGWFPKGIVKLTSYIFDGPPPQWFVIAMFESARAAILMMAAGFLVPFSQIWATLATLFIVSLRTSYGPYWSHAFNVQLLAALAFMFAPSADVWSVDSAIRRLRGLPRSGCGNFYWWPVIFAQLSVSLFMFGAFVQKFRETGWWWALSDNLRNAIAVSWLQYRSDAPDIALWIAGDPIVWKTAGLLQLFAQSTSILAAFLISRPVFRLIFGGAFFLGEIVGLGHVFRFWHPFWVPLCFLAIDYEYFWNRFLARGNASAQKFAPATANPRYMKLVISMGIIFFGYYLATLAFRLGETHLNYPFSTMGFFSETRALRPFGKHNYWPIYTGRIESYEATAAGTTSDAPVPLYQRVNSLEDRLFRVNTIRELKEIDASHAVWSGKGLSVLAPKRRSDDRGYLIRPIVGKKITYRAGLFAVTPYPEKLGFVELHSGLRAVRDENGFRALTASIDWDREKTRYVITLQHEGFSHPTFEVLARYDVRTDPKMSDPQPLPGTWEQGKFHVSRHKGDLRPDALIRVRDPVLKIDEIYYVPDKF